MFYVYSSKETTAVRGNMEQIATEALADPKCKKCVVFARDIENWENPYTGSLKELLAAAVEIYRTTYSDRSLIIKNPRNEGRYLQMTFPDWPALVHYEFLVHQKENFMGVELHVETDKSPTITTEMPLLCKSLQGQFGAYKLEYHPDWDKNGCRILVQVPADTTPESVAQTMANLVRLTSKTINDKLVST